MARHRPDPHAARAVARALEQLPHDHRVALQLTRSGLTFQQVAERLELPVERIRAAVLTSVLALTQARRAATPGSVPAL